ncbi:asparagine synthase (glutamine-hydrolyzing) [Akkermansiaceae bacterium]|nr:asparagine synthase (glutamine-hydrolyzing) [Akkermansiaceae bacterium]
MCGIAGIVGSQAEADTINKMLRVQHHRGPDYTGSSVKNAFVALGHNRLSIIDLSPEANQPMLDESGRYQLVFNGEIYNYLELKERLKGKYHFCTSSDTEVLLAAYAVWGKAMLDELNGMFAFAIYDNETGSLFAARDRFGVKPFYYAAHKGSLYFASEIKALKASGLTVEPNPRVWAQYLAHGSYGGAGACFWTGVNQLESGCFLEYNGSVKIERWYNFEQRVLTIDPGADEQSVLEEYERLLVDSVRLRFRADVSVGFNLSGGLDSSTLLALVNRNFPDNKNITAYTFYTGDDRYDELFWVEQMLQGADNPSEKVLLNVHDVPALAQELADIQDEPYGGIPTIAYYSLFKQARDKGCLALLDGQGMDEQWAGYDYYTNGEGGVVQGTKTPPTRSAVLNPEFKELALPAPEIGMKFDSRIKNLQYRDLFFTKIPRALRFNDRASMAASVELREPFLDYRLVELAFAQDDAFKIRKGQRKWMLRQIGEKLLSGSIAQAPKRPLQTPQREWLGGELAGFVDEHIERIRGSEFNTWFDADQMSREWLSYKNGQQDNAFYIWQWVSVGLLTQSKILV